MSARSVTLASGVVEIIVGNAGGTPSIQFTSETYRANLLENATTNTAVLQVSVGTTSRSVSYRFVSGNENAAFSISATSGTCFAHSHRAAAAAAAASLLFMYLIMWFNF